MSIIVSKEESCKDVTATQLIEKPTMITFDGINSVVNVKFDGTPIVRLDSSNRTFLAEAEGMYTFEIVGTCGQGTLYADDASIGYSKDDPVYSHVVNPEDDPVYSHVVNPEEIYNPITTSLNQLSDVVSNADSTDKIQVVKECRTGRVRLVTYRIRDDGSISEMSMKSTEEVCKLECDSFPVMYYPTDTNEASELIIMTACRTSQGNVTDVRFFTIDGQRIGIGSYKGGGTVSLPG